MAVKASCIDSLHVSGIVKHIEESPVWQIEIFAETVDRYNYPAA